MKFTLFTISNEQIKEQLSKLQTKVESLENVKDVQDKIISAKDSQITFLQGEISTIITWGSIAIGVITALAAVIYSYIKSLEEKAKDKIEEAESTLQNATEQLTEIADARQQIETNLTESDTKIDKLNSLIGESNKIATVAQGKLDELEETQKKINNLTTIAITNQKIDISIREISIQLDSSKYIIDQIIAYVEKPSEISQEQSVKLSYLNGQHASLLNAYRRLSSIFSADVTGRQKIDIDKITEGTNHLKRNTMDLYKDCIKLSDELDLLY
ncbi:hypothetical protein MKX31_28435 [Bacillus sp. FSL M8-0063]|uniref:hypothetical protein n=1 Tax=Bacillus sp. FSL M8-0063 TaxID=2921566 RepID=UPI0030F7BD57